MQIGRKIYFELTTGNVIIDTGERQGSIVETTVELDITTYKTLSERTRDTFDVIELPYGANTRDFAECNGYRVNVDSLATLPADRRGEALEFSYPDPNAPQAEPVYQKPLSVQNAELQAVQTQMSTDFQALTDLLVELGVI